MYKDKKRRKITSSKHSIFVKEELNSILFSYSA